MKKYALVFLVAILFSGCAGNKGVVEEDNKTKAEKFRICLEKANEKTIIGMADEIASRDITQDDIDKGLDGFDAKTEECHKKYGK